MNDIINAIYCKNLIMSDLNYWERLPFSYRYSKTFVLDILNSFNELENTIELSISLYNNCLIPRLINDKDIIRKIAENCYNNDFEEYYKKNNHLDNISPEIKKEYIKFKVLNKYNFNSKETDKAVKLCLKETSNLSLVSKEILLSEYFWLSFIAECDEKNFDDISNLIPNEFLNNHHFMVDVSYINHKMLYKLLGFIDYENNKDILLGIIMNDAEQYKLISSDLQNDIDIIKVLGFLDVSNYSLAKDIIENNENIFLELIDYTESEIFDWANINDINSINILKRSVVYRFENLLWNMEEIEKNKELLKLLIAVNYEIYDFYHDDFSDETLDDAEILECAIDACPKPQDFTYTIENKAKYRNIINKAYSKGILLTEKTPKWFLSDKELIKASIMKNCYIYEELPSIMKLDEELALQFIKSYENYKPNVNPNQENSEIIKIVPEKLLNNKLFLLKALEAGMSSIMIPLELRDDKDIIELAISKKTKDIYYIKIGFRSDINKMFDTFGENANTLYNITFSPERTINKQEKKRIFNVLKNEPFGILKIRMDFPYFSEYLYNALKFDKYIIPKCKFGNHEKCSLYYSIYSVIKDMCSKLKIDEKELLKITNTNVVLKTKEDDF